MRWGGGVRLWSPGRCKPSEAKGGNAQQRVNGKAIMGSSNGNDLSCKTPEKRGIHSEDEHRIFGSN